MITLPILHKYFRKANGVVGSFSFQIRTQKKNAYIGYYIIKGVEVILLHRINKQLHLFSDFTDLFEFLFTFEIRDDIQLKKFYIGFYIKYSLPHFFYQTKTKTNNEK